MSLGSMDVCNSSLGFEASHKSVLSFSSNLERYSLVAGWTWSQPLEPLFELQKTSLTFRGCQASAVRRGVVLGECDAARAEKTSDVASPTAPPIWTFRGERKRTRKETVRVRRPAQRELCRKRTDSEGWPKKCNYKLQMRCVWFLSLIFDRFRFQPDDLQIQFMAKQSADA